MRTGRYSMAELFGSRHIEQLVIPEIQRDYVWGNEQVSKFLISILNNFKAWLTEKEHPSFRVIPDKESQKLHISTAELEGTFASLCAKQYSSTNIGFIYAYTDGDLAGQYYLIDGQQRLTTIYLTLLATAAIANSEGIEERFRSRYCLLSTEPDSDSKSVKTRLDYRLRELTTDFFHHCVPYLLKNPSATGNLKAQRWYRQRLEGDKTIENVIANFKTIYGIIIEANISDMPSFYNYLEDLVDCWYFDSNESAQGEELYIYLNARGEDTAPNENLKARVLSREKDGKIKDDWGRKWEDWQDFFWQRRHKGITEGTNPNADRGFDCFLSCVTNLERMRTGNTSYNFEIQAEVIEKYFRCLEWLEQKKETFKQFYNLADWRNPDKPPYNYAGWVDSWFNEVWRIINLLPKTDWGVNPGDDNKSPERNRMVLMWGTLRSIACSFEGTTEKAEEIDISKVFRAIRIVWIRYKNFNRAVTSLPVAVNEFLSDKLPTFYGSESQEEKDKWILLKGKSAPERCEFESVIWEIEDHPLNIRGDYLGSLNISHLVELDAVTLTLDKLSEIRKSFFELFPPNKDVDKRIAQALFYYGVFWEQVKPWSYRNYNLDNWRRIIRGRGSDEPKSASLSETVFRRFFVDYMQFQISLDKFLEKKHGTVSIDPATTTDVIKALIWYSEKLGKAFLKDGWRVAILDSEKDKNFLAQGAIFNLHSDFRSTHQKMSDQVSNVK